MTYLRYSNSKFQQTKKKQAKTVRNVIAFGI